MAVDRLNAGCCGIAAATATADTDGRGDFCNFNWKIPVSLDRHQKYHTSNSDFIRNTCDRF